LLDRGGGFDVVSVVTQPPAPAGRKLKVTPSAVQAFAEERGLVVMAPEKARDPAFLEGLAGLEPDLCVTAAYGQFLPKAFLDIPR
jgi:methionyl-tRNA formyltransferase